MAPQNGKTMNQEYIRRLESPQLTLVRRLDAPVPMMAAVFAWVVLIGSPVSVAIRTQVAPAKSAEKAS